MVSGGLNVKTGRQIMINRAYSAVPDFTAPTVFKVGRGNATVTDDDTDLADAVPIGGTESVDDCDTADWTDGTDTTSSLNTTTFKEGTASLNLTKDGTSDVSCDVHKTTTSLNFTSKELSVWLYIIDQDTLDLLATSNCFIIRFGSGASDYYYWQYDKADLIVGWNLFQNLTSATATETGSPTITACDYTEIILTTAASSSTWSAGDVAVDDIKLVSSDDYTKTFESGYPAFDYNDMTCTIRGRLNTLQANGYNLSEVGVFNTDVSPLMDSRDTFTAISKSDTDELIYEVVSQLQEGE